MTLPVERANAVLATKNFLLALLDPKRTPHIPLHVRGEARACLRHYPHLGEVEALARRCPELLEIR